MSTEHSPPPRPKPATRTVAMTTRTEDQSFDAIAFERELADAEEQIQRASRQIALSSANRSTFLASNSDMNNNNQLEHEREQEDDDDNDDMLFRGVNILAGGREGLRRQRLAAADARLINPRATMMVTIIAWVIAIAVAIIAVTFATKEFIESIKTPLLATKFESLDKVRLPVLSICSTQLDIGGFGLNQRDVEKASGFTGTPLFTVRSLRNFENDSILFWPNVLNTTDESKLLITGAYRGPTGSECEKRFSAMDTNISLEDRTTSLAREDLTNHCQFCYQIGRYPPLYFQAKKEKQRSHNDPFAAQQNGLRLHFASSPFYRQCLIFDDVFRVYDDLWEFLRAEIRLNAKYLQQRGILDWNGSVTDFNDRKQLDRTLVAKISDSVVTEMNKKRINPTNMLNAAKDMMCHVYFWSGFFYPTMKRVNVKYKYNVSTKVWSRVGEGPYLRKFRTTTELIGPINLAKQGIDRASRPLEVYQEDPNEPTERIRVKSQDIIGANTLYRIKENAELVATIGDSTKADISFKVRKNDGELSFKVTTNLIKINNAAGRLFFYSNLINFYFESFLSETITKKESISVMQYLVDVVSYISMALGFTVFNLLIGPTNLFFCGFDRPRRKRSERAHNVVEQSEDSTNQIAGDNGSRIGSNDRLGGLRLRFGIERQPLTGTMEPSQRVV